MPNDIQLDDPYLTSGSGGFNSQVDPSLSPLSSGGGFNGSDSFGSWNQYGSLSPDYSNIGGGDLSSVGSATGVPSTSSTDSSGLDSGTTSTGAQPSWWQNLLSGAGNAVGGWSGLGKSLAGLGPYAAVAGIGMSQAKATQARNDARAKQLADLGGPYTAAGQALLKQFQSGQIRPDQQNVATLATQEGQRLIDSGTGLSAIAQQAYQNYQSGQLPQADELRLSQQTAAQKQELRARLGNITDSSILAGYDQQIDNQALMTRQQLLDARFQTGNQAYDEWLKSTTQGQQLKLEGAQFASKALDAMLEESLAVGTAGMQPVESAIQLAIQSDQQLSEQISQLLGNLSAAYAYTVSGPGRSGGAGGGGAGGGRGGNTMNTLLGDANKARSLYNDYQTFFGGGVSQAGIDTATTAATTDIGTTVGSTAASDATDIAASNDAWLSGFSSAGGGAAAGAGDVALSSVGTGAVDAASAASAADAAGALGGTAAADAGASGAASGGGAALGAAGGAAAGLGALGALYGLWSFDQAAGVMTPAMQYKDLENTSGMAQQQTQQLQQAIASGKAVPGPNGTYTINGIDASVYYPLAGKNAQQVAAANAPLAQNFLVDAGTDWAPDTHGVRWVGPGRGTGNQSVDKA